MLLQVLAATLLVFLLWSLFRFAMGLRWSKAVREESRRAEEERGRRVVAEIPAASGELTFFLEDARGFYWGAVEAGKQDLAGARLVLNGAVVGSVAAPGVGLPEPGPPEEFEGRERWDVYLYMKDGSSRAIPCGTLREGVSRDAAARVFGAVKAILAGEAS